MAVHMQEYSVIGSQSKVAHKVSTIGNWQEVQKRQGKWASIVLTKVQTIVNRLRVLCNGRVLALLRWHDGHRHRHGYWGPGTRWP